MHVHVPRVPEIASGENSSWFSIVLGSQAS